MNPKDNLLTKFSAIPSHLLLEALKQYLIDAIYLQLRSDLNLTPLQEQLLFFKELSELKDKEEWVVSPIESTISFEDAFKGLEVEKEIMPKKRGRPRKEHAKV